MNKIIKVNTAQLNDMRYGNVAQAWKTIKQAAGPTSNTQYERALSQIGMSVLQDRASDLLPYLAGFQLLDRSDDGEFAAGFFVFDANGLVIDAPLFMISGKIKGQQILFVRNSGVFVPSRDGIIRYLISRQKQNIGETGPRAGEPRPMRASPDIGVFSVNNRFLQKQASYPEILSFWGKQAGVYESWCSIHADPGTQKVAHSLRDGTWGKGLLNLAVQNVDARNKLASICRVSPLISQKVAEILGPVDQWYTPKMKLDLTPRFSLVRKVAEAEAEPVKLYTQPPVDAAGERRDKMIGEILMFGFSAEDMRDAGNANKTIPIVDASGWSTPTESGLYEVIDPDGGTNRSMVFIGRDRFINSGGRSLVIRTSDNAIAEALDGDIAVPTLTASNPKETFKEIFDRLPTYTIDSVSGGKSALIISPEGLTVGPFHFPESSVDGVIECHRLRPECQSSPELKDARLRSSGPYHFRIRVRDDYSSFELSDSDCCGPSELIIPKGSKYISLPSNSSEGDDEYGYREPKEFRILAISHIDLRKVNKQAGFDVRRMSKGMVTVNGQPMTNRQAGYMFIKQAGLHADYVKNLLRDLTEDGQKFAIVPGDVEFQPWMLATKKIAIAQGPNVQQNMTEMMFDHPEPMQGNEQNWFQTPNQEVREDMVISPMAYGDPTSPKANPMYSGYSDPQVISSGASSDPTSDPSNLAQEIANSPEKMFENKVFLSLLRKARIENEISKYTEALFKLCDQTGRILFLIYAHPEEFADFYGEKDVDTLEEQLLTIFESGGDLLAELLEQSVGTSDNITLASLDQAT